MINDSTMNSTNEAGVMPTNDSPMDGILVPKINFETVGKTLSGNEISECSPEQNYDYSSCSSTKLRKKFPRTYKCWDNMKQRRKKGAIIHKEFASFDDFLGHVGHCEDSQYTLDRLDNSDPEYAPGKVEWRDKFAQNSNKGNNVYLTHEDGRIFTIAQWAAKTNQLPTTLYKRKANGWNDMEVITGIREAQNLSINDNPWPYDRRQELEALYRQAILAGSGKSRLVFLRDTLRKNISGTESTCHLLGLIVKEKSGYEYEDERDEYLAMQELWGQDQMINAFENASVDNMMIIINEYEESKSISINILKEVDAQIEYENNKEKLLAKRDESISQSVFLKYFDEVYPRPAYTVNLPASDGQVIV